MLTWGDCLLTLGGSPCVVGKHLLIRLSQKTKILEYQKYLLTLDGGWSNKLSCKISAFYRVSNHRPVSSKGLFLHGAVEKFDIMDYYFKA